MYLKLIIISSVLAATSSTFSVSAAISDAATCANEADSLSRFGHDDQHEQRITKDIASALSDEFSISVDDLNVPRSQSDVDEAIRDCSPEAASRGEAAWKFLYGLASSKTFVQEFWHKRPLLLRAANTGGWVEGFFTVDRDLRLIDNSYITGYKTAEILRNGTKTDTWALSPLKDNPARKTLWADVKDALDGGTVYFNTAGSLWPNLGGLCRLTSFAFGLPPNVNVYVTPPGCTLSVPPHTDRQDVLVFQTQGAKRWRVFAPPPRSKGKDPLDRGKGGDVLGFEEMGPPLIDTVLRTGDVLYVPTGFPHTTDTSTTVDGTEDSVFQEPSLHLTMGLDTHVWCLTMAHLRWTLLQRCGKEFNLAIHDDNSYWNAMEAMPLGFLGGDSWKECVKSLADGHGVSIGFKKVISTKLKAVLLGLEPHRWADSTASAPGTEALPTEEEINEVTEYMVSNHWDSLMRSQEALFKDIDSSSEDSVVKAFHGIQEQNLIMEKYGEFSKNEAFRSSFAQRRLSAQERTKGAF